MMLLESVRALWARATRPGPTARMWVLAAFSVAVLVMVAVSDASAQEAADQPDTPVVTGLPLGIIIVSVGMTIVGYGLNYLLPFLKTDAQKGVATAIYQAAGVTIFELATGSNFGFNQETLVAFITAMATWAFAHGLIFKPTTWSTKLGAGRNLSEERPR